MRAPGQKAVLSVVWTPAPGGRNYIEKIKFQRQLPSPSAARLLSQVGATLGSLVVAASEKQVHSGHGALPLEVGMSPKTAVLGAALLCDWLLLGGLLLKKTVSARLAIGGLLFWCGEERQSKPLILPSLHNKSKYCYLWDGRPGHQTAGWSERLCKKAVRGCFLSENRRAQKWMFASESLQENQGNL